MATASPPLISTTDTLLAPGGAASHFSNGLLSRSSSHVSINSLIPASLYPPSELAPQEEQQQQQQQQQQQPVSTTASIPCTCCGHELPPSSTPPKPAASISNTSGSPPIETVYKTISQLEASLQRHGADLHQIELIAPKYNSRAPSVRSVVDSGDVDASVTVATKDSAVHADGLLNVTNKDRHDHLQNVHPLLYDVEDLRQLTAGVTRLLKTLHDKVSKVEIAERMLRTEREDVAREKGEAEKLREGLERLTKRGSAVPPTSRPISKHSRSESHTCVDDDDSLVDVAEMRRTISFSASLNDGPQLPAWTSEKERTLKELEDRLRHANRKWSDEQEDVLELLEPLKEERRQARKAARRDSLRTEGEGERLGKVSLERSASKEPRSRQASGGAGTLAEETNKRRGVFLRFLGFLTGAKKSDAGN